MKHKFLIALGACLTLAGCNYGFSTVKYDNSDKYQVAGEAELNQNVTNIEVSWISGNISILGSEQEFVSFVEVPKYDLEDNQKLHYLVENETLYIQCAAVGSYESKFLEKDLTIRVPKNSSFDSLNASLKDLKIETVSSPLTITEISAKMDIDMVSGNININKCAGTELEVDSVSGNIDVKGCDFTRINIDNVSGKVELDNLNSTNNLNVDVTSGNIYLKVEELTGFKIEFNSTSGKIHSDLELKQNGNTSIYKNGSREFNVETTSGSLYLS